MPQYDEWTPTLLGDRVLAYTNRITVLDRVTGMRIGEISDPAYYWNGYAVFQTPIVLGNRAFVTNGSALVAYDLAALAVAFRLSINAGGQVSTDGETLFVVSSGSISTRSPVDGALLWAVEPPTGNFVTPFIVTRKHIIASTASSTYLINRRTHALERAWPFAGKLAYGDDSLIIGEQSGRVTAINLDTTPLLADGFE